jgi:hypothetical protein
LVPLLPANIDFNAPTYTYDWENYIGSTGGPFQLGITCHTTDPRLIVKLTQRLGTTAPYFVSGSSLTLVIVDPSGNY